MRRSGHDVPQWARLTLPGVPGPLILPQDDGLSHALDRCMAGWTVARAPMTPDPAAVGAALCIAGPAEAGGYHLRSRYVEEPMDGLTGATTVCAMIADIGQGWCDALTAAEEGALGLHCGAIGVGGRAILLAGAWRAGKSTLVTRLSAEPDVALLCDDVLPVDAAGHAVGLGLAPRLRLPLPTTAGAAFRDHVARYSVLEDDRYAYVRPPSLVPHGTRLPVAALVLLDRRPGAAAQLSRMDEGEVVQHILQRCLSGPGTPEAALGAARSLSRRMTGLRLVHDGLEEAAALLMAHLRGVPQDSAAPSVPAADGVSVPCGTVIAADAALRRAPGVVARTVGGSIFLWRPGETMLWSLNPVGQAIWAVLAIPGSADDVVEVLDGSFAGILLPQLKADTLDFMARLAEAGLIEPDPDAGQAGA